MTNLKFRYIIVILLMVLTSAVVQALQYAPDQDDEAGLATLQTVPFRFSKWQGTEHPLLEEVYDILETRAIIHRSFTSDEGSNAFLSIVHYQDTKVGFHEPESCLGAKGLKLDKSTKTVTIQTNGQSKTFNLSKLISTNENGSTLVYYFYKAGQFIGSNYLKMRLNIAFNKLTSNDTKGSLIRISTNLTPGREKEAERILVDFLQDLFPYVNNSL